MLKRRAVCWIAAAALLLAAAAGCVCYLNRYRSFDAEVPVFLPETGESAILSVSVSARRNLFTKALEFREGSISFNGVKLPVSHFLDPYGGTVSLVFKGFNPLSIIPPDEATDRRTTRARAANDACRVERRDCRRAARLAHHCLLYTSPSPRD